MERYKKKLQHNDTELVKAAEPQTKQGEQRLK